MAVLAVAGAAVHPLAEAGAALAAAAVLAAAARVGVGRVAVVRVAVVRVQYSVIRIQGTVSSEQFLVNRNYSDCILFTFYLIIFIFFQ